MGAEIDSHLWVKVSDSSRPNAVYLMGIDRGEGVSPSVYYSYTPKVTTGARRPRPYQRNVSKQH